MSGLAGAGKTWLILDLGIETARGGMWLGHFQCTKGTVVIMNRPGFPGGS
jgi:RecA-family ATPase